MTEYFNKIKNLGKSEFFTIFLLTFTNGLSFAMLIPVLPFIIRSYDQPEIYLGILLATYSLFQFFSAPVLGALSDYFGRKPVLLVTQTGTLLAWIILGIAYLMPETEVFSFILLPILIIFLARAIDGLTGGNVSVAKAYIADKTHPSERSKVFGKNSSVMGFAIIIGPALGSLSMSTSYEFLGTAILGALVSVMTLGIMYFQLSESLDPKNKNESLDLDAKKLNIVSQFVKWKGTGVITYASVMRFFLFIAFISGSSIGTLYLLDTFGFTGNTVGYYLAFTGTFIVLHQSVSIGKIVDFVGDRNGLIIGLVIMGAGYIGQALSGQNIYLFTICNFFTVLGIATCFSTNSGLFSKSVDESEQGEILGFTSSIKSFVSIWVPPLATYIYGIIDFSIYFIIGAIPIITAILGRLYFGKPRYKQKES